MEDFEFYDGHVKGDVYVDGDLTLGLGTTVDKNIYYTGRFIHSILLPRSIKNKCIKVDSIPTFEIPKLCIEFKDNEWYEEKGYNIIDGIYSGTIRSSTKMLINEFYGSVNGSSGVVVIVSRGDIKISDWRGSIKGVLIAPNGSVNINKGEFNGVIISKDMFKQIFGSGTVNMELLSDLLDIEDVPVVMRFE